MTIYKVISNYYTDLLDFLNIQHKKYNNNFDTYFTNITDENKKILIDKIANVFQKLEILKKSESNFWKSKTNQGNAMMAILIIMIILIFFMVIILGVFFTLNSKSIGSVDKVKYIILYITLYLIIFTILLLLVVNIAESRKRNKKMISESGEDIDNMRNLIDVANELRILFIFISFKKNENKNEVNKLLKNNANLISKYTKTGENKFENISINYKLVFEDYKNELKKAIEDFYDNGNGYETLRKELVGSSNILILKEFTSILDYYYKLLSNKNNFDSINKDEENVNLTIDRYVISELKNIDKLFAGPNPNAYILYSSHKIGQTPDIDLTINNENPEFINKFNRVIDTYKYIILHFYQVHEGKTKDDVNFNTAIKSLLPTELDITAITPTDQLFSIAIKDIFIKHYNDNMDNLIKNVPKEGDPREYYVKNIKYFIPTLEYYYNDLMTSHQGDYLFPFDVNYVENMIKEKLSGFGFLDEKYASTMIDIIKKDIIILLYTNYKLSTDIDKKVNEFVLRIVNNLVAYDLYLRDNSQYILNKLISDDTENKDKLTQTYINIISRIDDDLMKKRQLSEISSSKLKTDTKFITLTEFSKGLDEIPYNDLKSGLNNYYFKDIVERFYYSVSNAINTRSYSAKDIYFNDEKSFKLAKISVTLIIIIIIFGLIYNSINIFQEYADIADNVKNNAVLKNPSNEDEYNKRSFKYVQDYSNTIIKGVLPWIIGFFFITVIISFYRKGKAKYNFNKSIIDTNTSELRSSLQELCYIFDDLDSKIDINSRNKKIKDITVFTSEEKQKIYNLSKNILDRAQKCNYILKAKRDGLPFPYAETIVDLFMIILIIIAILYMFGKINPIERFKDIKVLNKLKERSEYSEGTKEFNEELSSRAKCHDQDMDGIIFAIKIILVMFVIMFLIFYATKVIASTNQFEYGLYTTSNYEESRYMP